MLSVWQIGACAAWQLVNSFPPNWLKIESVTPVKHPLKVSKKAKAELDDMPVPREPIAC
jgi:hypothetical protein